MQPQVGPAPLITPSPRGRGLTTWMGLTGWVPGQGQDPFRERGSLSEGLWSPRKVSKKKSVAGRVGPPWVPELDTL